MTNGKETSAVAKDGVPASAQDQKSMPEKKPGDKPEGLKNQTVSKPTTPVKPPEDKKEKVPAKPKTELELAWDEIAALKTQLKKATLDIDEWKEKYVYLQAEFDNAEKRRAKANEGQRKRMQADIIFAFLPLVDSFIPAVKKAEEGAYKDVCQLGEGLKSLKQQLDSILKGLNAVPIDQTKVPLDYNLHEVTLSQVAPELPEDTVMAIVQVGWKLGSDVIRPAKVIVAKKPAPPPTCKPETEATHAEVTDTTAPSAPETKEKNNS